jgi:hypothetical protein
MKWIVVTQLNDDQHYINVDSITDWSVVKEENNYKTQISIGGKTIYVKENLPQIAALLMDYIK